MPNAAIRTTFALLPLLWVVLPQPATAVPTEYEQYMVELINRARLDPASEVTRLGTGSLNEGPPTLGGNAYLIQDGPHQPVAISNDIVDAARGYATLLNDNNTFCHTCFGTDAEDRMFAEGYVPLLSFFDFFDVAGYTLLYGAATPVSFVPGRENLAFAAEGPSNGMIDDLTAAVANSHAGLFNDFDTASRGHRSTMMYGEWKEIGVGINEGLDGSFDSVYIVTNFAHRSDTGPFITGVAFDDQDGDDFYTPDFGEAIGGMTVEAFTAGTANLVNSTTTLPSGGYKIEVPVGTYDVKFSQGGFNQTFPNIVVASGPEGIPENTKVDLTSLAAGVDADADGVPDDADNCVGVFNPALGSMGQPARESFQTTTGGQLDDDGDGFGNPCDAKFGTPGQFVGGVDVSEHLASFNKNRSGSNCGISGSAPCAQFDLDNSGQIIGGTDILKTFQLFNQAPGPKCVACPLACVGPNCP